MNRKQPAGQTNVGAFQKRTERSYVGDESKDADACDHRLGRCGRAGTSGGGCLELQADAVCKSNEAHGMRAIQAGLCSAGCFRQKINGVNTKITP